MDNYGPCPICGGAPTETEYDRSAGQVSCGGACGWALPADAWQRLSDAARLARTMTAERAALTTRVVALAGEVGE